MTDVHAIIARVRAKGADILLERGKMTVINGAKLGNEGMAFLRQHQDAIEQYLRERESVAAVAAKVSEDDTPPLTWEQTARILYAECPEGRDKLDWSYFVTEMGKVMRGHFGIGVEP